MGRFARWPWQGGGIVDRVENPQLDEVHRPPPATAEELGAGVVLDLDPSDGTRERRIRGRDGAAKVLAEETARRGYPMGFEAARDRVNTALGRRDRRSS